MSEVNAILSQIGVLFYSLIFVILVLSIKPLYALVNTYAKSSALDLIKKYALTYVSDLAKNKAWEKLSGPEKKQRAVLWLVELSKKNKYEMDEEFAGKIVEETYIAVKRIIEETASLSQ